MHSGKDLGIKFRVFSTKISGRLITQAAALKIITGLVVLFPLGPLHRD